MGFHVFSYFLKSFLKETEESAFDYCKSDLSNS
mgnify:CR=1 FL=1